MNEIEKLLASLTPLQAKVDAYAGDTYFQECANQLVDSGADLATFAHEHTLLLLKPDAVVGRAMEPTVHWLRDNGFRIAAVRRMSVNRHQARALWYYQWNIASTERRHLADLLVTISDAVLLVLHADTDDLPTAVTFCDRKGPTAPSQREPGHLRHLLGRYTYLLNLVHSPDDPADVVRELAIYFDEPERKTLFGELSESADRSADAMRIGAELADEIPARSFDKNDAVATLLRDLAGIPEAQAVTEAAGAGTDGAYADLIHTAWANDWPLDPWAVIVLGSHVLPMRTGTQPQTLGAVSAADWREAHHDS